MMFRKRLSIILLFFSIISIFLLGFSFISLSISIFTFLLCFIFSRNNIRIFLFTLVISLFTIIANCIILFKTNHVTTDPYMDINVILGAWIYNDYGGNYVFNEDYSYIKYYSSNSDDNYCVGNYEYSFGGVSNEGEIIMEDDNFYYYNLDLNVEYCYTNKEIKEQTQEEKMVFAFGKDKDTFLLIDKKNEVVFSLKK